MRSNISGTNRLEWFLKDSESQGNSQPTRVDFGFLLDSPQRTKRKGNLSGDPETKSENS